MEMEAIKTTLSEIIEAAGESGVTEGQATKELVTKYKVGYYEALEALRNGYKEIGLERTPEHTGAVIFYRKPRQPTQKNPEELAAVRLAKKLGSRGMSEKERMAIIAHYTR